MYQSRTFRILRTVAIVLSITLMIISLYTKTTHALADSQCQSMELPDNYAYNTVIKDQDTTIRFRIKNLSSTNLHQAAIYFDTRGSITNVAAVGSASAWSQYWQDSKLILTQPNDWSNWSQNQTRSFDITFRPNYLFNATPIMFYASEGTSTPATGLGYCDDVNGGFAQVQTSEAPPASCPEGQTGTYPDCTTPPPTTCPEGQVGTPPDCTTPPTGGSGAPPDAITPRDLQLIGLGITLFIGYKFINAFRYKDR